MFIKDYTLNNPSVLLNLNKDLVFVHSVSFFYMHCFHHPSYLRVKLMKKISLVKTGRFVILDAHPTGKAVLHLHCLYHGTLLAVTDLDKIVIEIGPHFTLSLFKMQLSPDHRQRL